MLPAGREKKEQFGKKKPEHPILNGVCPQEKLFSQNLTYSGFIRAKLTWEKGNNQIQPVLTFHLG